MEIGGGYLWMLGSGVYDGQEWEVLYNNTVIYRGVISPVAVDQLPEKSTISRKEIKDSAVYRNALDGLGEHDDFDAAGIAVAMDAFFDKIATDYNWKQ